MNIESVSRERARTERMLLLAVALLTGAFALAGLLPTSASANGYPIYMCAGGYGSGALEDGWSSTAGKALATAANCTQPSVPFGKGDGLQAWSSGAGTGTEAGGYWLHAPAGTSITSLTYAGVFNSEGGWSAHWATAENGGGDPTTGDCDSNCSSGTFLDASYSVPNASLIGFGLWCDQATCDQNSSQSLFGPAGTANVFNATIWINDPEPPSLAITATPHQWISDRAGASAISASASDPGGICSLTLSAGSLVASNDVVANDGSSAGTPCRTGQVPVSLDVRPCQPGGLGPGQYAISASAMNPASMTSSTDGGQFSVECSGPQVSVTSTENLGVWYSGTQYVVVDASDESGLQGPVTCTVGSATVTVPAAQLPDTVPVTQNGANAVSCTAENNVSYTTTANLSGNVQIDNQTPSVSFSGPVAAPAWVSGPQTVTVTGSEQAQLSGIASVACQLDGGGWNVTNGSVASVRITTDGVHTVDCYTTTGAGVESPTTGYTVQLDSMPPSVSFSNATVASSTWSSTPESIEVTATKPNGSSGVAAISCTLAGQTTQYPNSGSPYEESVKLQVSQSAELSCTAQDNAGNQSTPALWSFLIDTQTPSVSITGASAVSPAWASGPQTLSVTGSELVRLSGIASVSCQVNGGDWATTAGPTASVKLTNDGVYAVSCYSTTAAGLDSKQETYDVQIDSSPPGISFSDAPASQATWSAAPESIVVTATKPAGTSGVAEIVCTLAGATTSYPNNGSPDSESVKIQTAQSADLSCKARDNAGNVSAPIAWSFLIDAQTPTVDIGGASAVAPAWVSGPQTVTVTASETTSLSGITSVACQLNGGAWSTTAGAAARMTLSADGVYVINCYATTGAGVQSEQASYTVQIDSSIPAVTFSGGPSQSKWSTSAQSIEVTASKPGGDSAVSDIVCSLDGDSTSYANTGGPDSETVKIQVTQSGALSCKAQDAAGHWSSSVAWNFLIDTSAPTGEFLAPEASDPTQVRFQAADAVSGVAGVQIEIQTASGWQQLQTSLDASTDIATATIPDDGTLPDGTYQLQALVWSVAGNQATLTLGVAGPSGATTPAEVTLPLRIVTQILVGPVQAAATSCTVAGLAVAPPRSAVAPSRSAVAPSRSAVAPSRTAIAPSRTAIAPRWSAGSASADRTRPAAGGAQSERAPTRLVKRCKHVQLPEDRAVRLGFGQRSAVTGVLETVDGTPVPDASIEVAQQPAGWPAQPVGEVSTDAGGRFTYPIAPGPSRAVTFTYAGTQSLRPARAAAGVSVAGRGTITVARHAVAGKVLRISGQLFGGFIPPEGVLVQLWYRIRGVPAGFAPFDHAIHTDANGAWSITFPVAPGARGYTYLFKAVIAQQTGWPFLATSTNVVPRRVS